jgi:2-dehydropantoate 2-reductase
VRHVILGGGAHGSLVASSLVRGGESVVVVEREARRREQIARDGIRIAGFRGEAQARVDVVGVDGLRAMAPLDAVHVCVKPVDVASAVDAVLPAAAPGTVFISHAGGLTPFALAARAGSARTVVAVPNMESMVRDDGVVETDFHNFAWLGELDGRFTERLDALQAALSWVGPALVTRVVRGMVWAKAIYSLEVALSTLIDAPPAEVYAERAHRRLAAALVRENIAVADAAGIEPIAFDFFDPNLYRAKGDGEGNVMDIWIKHAWARHEGFRTGFEYPFPAKAGLSWSFSPGNPAQETTSLCGDLIAEAAARRVAIPLTERFAAIFTEAASGRRALGAANLRELDAIRDRAGIRVPGSA